MVVEPDMLSWAMLTTAVNCLAGCYAEQSIPLLIFPSQYMSLQNIPEEKQYALWILNARDASDDFLAYMNRLIKLKSVS
jgi:hypothetical protein